MKAAPPWAAHESEMTIMHASNHVYLGTGAKGGDPPKSKIKTKPLAFCSGVNHGGLGGNPLTPNPTKSVQGVEADGAPKTKNRCKNREKTKNRGGTTNAPPLGRGATNHWRMLPT